METLHILLDFFEETTTGLRIETIMIFNQGITITLDDRKGCAQLVRDICHEFFAHFLQLAQTRDIMKDE